MWRDTMPNPCEHANRIGKECGFLIASFCMKERLGRSDRRFMRAVGLVAQNGR